MIDGIAVGRIINIRRIVIACATGDERTHAHSNDDGPHVTRGITRLHGATRRDGLCHIRNVVDRRTGWDCVDLLRYGSRSEEHTSELQSQSNLVCRLLLEKKKKKHSKENSKNT